MTKRRIIVWVLEIIHLNYIFIIIFSSVIIIFLSAITHI